MTLRHSYIVCLISTCIGLSLLGSRDSAMAETSPTSGIENKLQSILSSSILENVETGVHVRRLSDGKTLFAHNSEQLFNPASNMKLLTTAAALWYLGPAYRFQTTVRRDDKLVSQTVKGNLYIEAGGDPTLTTENLFGLVNQIALSGISKFDGNLVIDDTFFDQISEGPGWEQEVGDHAYNAPIGAFSINFNTFVAHIVPGERSGAPAQVLIWPPVNSIITEVNAKTRGQGSRTRLWFGTSRTPDDRVRLTVRGRIALDDRKGRSLRKRVHAPTQYAGETLKHLLGLRGVKITGRVRRGTIQDKKTVIVARRLSRPLGDIVSTLNKYSNNFMAEQILKTLAAEIAGPPGTWTNGKNVLENFLAEIGITSGRFVLGNGSGLNDVNRLKPSQITHILQVMHSRFELAPEYVASLAVAGESGTISSRFDDSPAASRIRAKTGTLTGVSALSGYVATRGNELLAFSVIMNNYKGRARAMWNIQEQIGVALSQLEDTNRFPNLPSARSVELKN